MKSFCHNENHYMILKMMLQLNRLNCFVWEPVSHCQEGVLSWPPQAQKSTLEVQEGELPQAKKIYTQETKSP